MSPTKTLLDWISGLSPNLRDELVFSIAVMLPGISPDRSITEGIEAFQDDVLALASTTLTNAGMALSLVTLIDFFLTSRPSTPEEVQNVQDANERMAELAEGEGQERLAGILRRSANGMPFRGKQWAQVKESWKELTSGALAKAAIDEWLRYNLGPART